MRAQQKRKQKQKPKAALRFEANSGVAKILGPLATLDSIVAMGGSPATWVENFREYEPAHYEWAVAQGDTMWEDANYYDRAKIYYAMSFAATGEESAEYLAKGHELALNYRDYYTPEGNVSAHWNMATGVALHYLLTGDERSKTWLSNVGVTMSAPYYTDGIGNIKHSEIDCRIQGRCLETFLLNLLVSGDETTGYNGASWESLLRDALPKILSTQNDAGFYPWPSQGKTSKPFMTGILHDAFILYERVFEQDDRIKPAMQRACDYMWQNDWIERDQSFIYDGQDTSGGAPDLNNLVINGFDALDMRDEVAKILAGSERAWLDGDKQFNQTYTQAHQTIARMDGAQSAWEGDGGEPPVEPPIEPPIDPPVQPGEPDVAGARRALDTAQRALAVSQEAMSKASDAVMGAQKAVDVALRRLG